MDTKLNIVIFEDMTMASLHVKSAVVDVFEAIGIEIGSINIFTSMQEYLQFKPKPNPIHICFLDHNLATLTDGEKVLAELKMDDPEILSFGISDSSQEYIDAHITYEIFGKSKTHFLVEGKADVDLNTLVRIITQKIQENEDLKDLLNKFNGFK